MTNDEMFEKSFERPSDYFELSAQHQWEIDSRLGILDWEGGNLSPEQQERFQAHYRTRRGHGPSDGLSPGL